MAPLFRTGWEEPCKCLAIVNTVNEKTVDLLNNGAEKKEQEQTKGRISIIEKLSLNVEKRCSVEKWILYDLLKKKWERMGLGDYSKQIVNTLYGNPLRRAWIELNYIYCYIIREIEKMSFKNRTR